MAAVGQDATPCLSLPAKPPELRFTKLKLVQFKNYREETFYFHERLNCLVGLNGTGKTNVLDALHTLCMTKSKFTGQDKLLIHDQDSFYRIEGEVLDESTRRNFYVIKYAREGKKTLEKNHQNIARSIDHVGQIPLVFYSPDDHMVLSGPSADRRKLMDQTISQADNAYLDNLVTYNRLLKHRNALLARFQMQRQLQPQLLDAIDHQLLPVGQALVQSRQEFADGFSPQVQEKYGVIAGGKESVEWKYKPSLLPEEMQRVWSNERQQDLNLGRTMAGPHRDDWQVMLGRRSAKRYASQGQMKTIMLSMRWAQWNWLKLGTEKIPLLLIDDLFDKLDEERIKHFLQLIGSLTEAQVFVTYTHPEMLQAHLDDFQMPYKMFYINEGAIADEETK
ncbi:MAG: DNA replication/repair protein RecF [Saprospiraceae bacterium]|nr:DNA replication/repair protein RecF [Saprospiraceae bacterium]MCB9318883.1 DNA replication/repair protein RecF [Lewinellaceae bacterium]